MKSVSVLANSYCTAPASYQIGMLLSPVTRSNYSPISNKISTKSPFETHQLNAGDLSLTRIVFEFWC